MTQPTSYQSYQPTQSGYDHLPPAQNQESLGSWVLVVFILFIPIVNVIYLLVLAFGATTSIAKRNFARASLIWMAIGLVVSIVLGILVASAGLSIFSELTNTYFLMLS